MSCGCSGSTKDKVRVNNPETAVRRVAQTIKRAWESTQAVKPTHIIKRVNKK